MYQSKRSIKFYQSLLNYLLDSIINDLENNTARTLTFHTLDRGKALAMDSMQNVRPSKAKIDGNRIGLRTK